MASRIYAWHRSARAAAVAMFALTGLACDQGDEGRRTSESGDSSERRMAYCHYYQAHDGTRIGSCSTVKELCEGWREETKDHSGTHSHTECQPQEKVWCFLQPAEHGGDPSYFSDCFPSKATCEDGRLKQAKFKEVSSNCEHVSLDTWLASLRRVHGLSDEK